MKKLTSKIIFKPESHRGGALIMAMIILVLLTIISLAGMNTSNLELKMSSNLQQQTVSFQHSENARSSAERLIRTSFASWMDPSGNGIATTLPTTPGFYNVLAGTAAPNVTSRAFWLATSNSMVCADSRCTIEYLGRQPVVLDDRITNADEYVFRITAYGKTLDGTDSIVQAIFLVS